MNKIQEDELTFDIHYKYGYGPNGSVFKRSLGRLGLVLFIVLVVLVPVLGLFGLYTLIRLILS